MNSLTTESRQLPHAHNNNEQAACRYQVVAAARANPSPSPETEGHQSSRHRRRNGGKDNARRRLLFVVHAYSPNLTLFGNVDFTYFKVRLIFLRFHILIWSSKNLCEGSNYSLKYLVFWMLLEQLSGFGRKCLGHLKVLAINVFSQ